MKMLKISEFVKNEVLKSIPTSVDKLEIEVVSISRGGVKLKIRFVDNNGNELLYGTLPLLYKGERCTILDLLDLSITLESD